LLGAAAIAAGVFFVGKTLFRPTISSKITVASSGRVSVISQDWLAPPFCSICDDKELIESTLGLTACSVDAASRGDVYHHRLSQRSAEAVPEQEGEAEIIQ
jgi:hypothetical protein